MKPNRSFWSGKRVLLTGHTGFKGSWLALWLSTLGSKVTGVSLPPATNPNLFSLAGIEELIDSRYADIRDAEQLSAIVKEAAPDIVFHLAAQALVRTSYQQPLATLATNVMGTAHLLEALRGLASVKAAVLITTDKVYHNQEWPYPYRENDPLGGHDPYSASKAASEIVAASYRDAFLAEQGVAMATARAGNVIGGGDWSADRLIPDAVRAWEADKPMEVRRPGAIRPWQHVLEPLGGYLLLAEQLYHEPDLVGAYNFGPDTSTAATVREVIELAQKFYGKGRIVWGDGSKGPHEAGCLALEIAKARTTLGVVPKWTLTEAIERTMHWYNRQNMGADPQTLCLSEIADFEAHT
ncbi:MAG: CDP-glucose 4,6-dehydratase [Proteobacteria bacterium]|nr:CDP-glucose 4,6-dehydratase [Pseudomonadota bacterium]MBU1649805.1 CDP-glucose 4,6-dehydratase [Pseudomonadota bacterium]